MSAEKTEALRLADRLESRFPLQQAAAELRRLHQFAEDQIGRATAAEAALQMTKATHALKIAAVEAQRDALLEALRALVRNEGLDAYSYLDKGIGTATAAGQRWLNARAAIKAAEEGK